MGWRDDGRPGEQRRRRRRGGGGRRRAVPRPWSSSWVLTSGLSLLALPLLWGVPPASAQSSWGYTYNVTAGMLSKAWNAVVEPLGLTDYCPFAMDFAEVAKRAVHARIRCQDRALNVITTGLSHWEMDLMGEKPHPLILAFTGPTGVGKTETAHVIARAMLTKTEIVGTGKWPRGLLVLRGEDFGDPHMARNVSTYVDTIKGMLFHHLTKCQGHAVVIFDEIQKVIPGTLEALSEAISEQSTLSLYKDGVLHRVDTSHVAFFLISDIGWEDMLTLIVQHGGDPSKVPQHVLAKRVKSSLDQQWQRLRFGKLIDKVVPFLPLSEAQLREILDLKLEEMSREHSGRLWSRLETTAELRDYLVRNPFVKYAGYAYEEKAAAAGVVAAASSNSNHNKGGVCEAGGGSCNNKDKRGGFYWFAEFGARNLHIGGPIQALESAMVESMKPWRPDQVLDARYDAGKDEVQLRWCPEEIRRHAHLAPSEAGGWGLLAEEAGGGRCELRWSGNLKERVG